jgi:hypothetical protein
LHDTILVEVVPLSKQKAGQFTDGRKNAKKQISAGVGQPKGKFCRGKMDLLAKCSPMKKAPGREPSKIIVI